MINYLGIIILDKEFFMNKVLKHIIITVLALVCACSFIACTDGEDGTKDKGLLCKKINGVYTIYKYVDEGEGVTELDIEKELAELEITDTNIRIQSQAFNGNDTLEKVIVPSSVTKIEKGAFAGMKKLKEITLPFVGMTARADVAVGDTADDTSNPIEKSVDAERTIAHIFGDTEYAEGIAQSISYGTGEATVCYFPVSLKKITVKPQGEYNIPASAFNGMTKAVEIVLDGSIKEIGNSAFANVKQMDEITLPASITKIHDNAFSGASALETINLSALTNLSEIGAKAFNGTALKEIILPTSLKTVGEQAFVDCKVLKTVTLNVGLEKIARYAFKGCIKLETVDTSALATNSLELGDYAFLDCEKLTGFDQTKCSSVGVNAIPSNP